MFENLTTKLQGVFKRLSGKGRLSEQDVDVALREVRLALLEADVNFRVVKDFVSRVRERAVGADVMKSLSLGSGRIEGVQLAAASNSRSGSRAASSRNCCTYRR